MKYSLIAMTIASSLLLAGCGKDSGCSSCGTHDEMEHVACSACPTTLPTEEAVAVVEEDMISDEAPAEEIIVEEVTQK